MKKTHKKTELQSTPLLEYQVTPQEIYYTRDSLNPSVVILTIGATNTSSQDVTIDGIQVRIIVKEDGTDPKVVLTDQPSTIHQVSLKPEEWSFERIDDKTYEASPLTGGVIPAKRSITFQLQGVIVNESDGTTSVTIVEKSASGFQQKICLVNKIRSLLNIDRFNANPVDVPPGGTTTLSWATTAAASVTLLPGNPPGLKTTDSYVTTLTETTTYTLTAYGEGPNVSQQFAVSVAAVRIVSFTASLYQVNAGDPVTLTWVTENANKCSINPGFSNLGTSGSVQVNPLMDTVYVLTAFSLSGKMENSPLEIKVNPVVIENFTASPDYGVGIGTPVNLNWNVLSTTGVMLSPGIGTVAASGNTIVMPGSKTIFSLAAQGKGGPVTRELTVIPMMTGWQTPTKDAPWNDIGQPVLLMKDKKMWMMAMGDSSFVFASDDGAYWNVTGKAGWSPRSSAGGAVLNGKLWLMGGAVTGASVTNDVWNSADGANWTLVKSTAAWSARRNFGCIGYGGKLWVMGGLSASGTPLNDVWNSVDGENWTQVTANASWSPRSNFSLIEFNGTMYVVCGKLSSSSASKELWYSTNGSTWTPTAPSNTLSQRYDPNSCAIENRLYIAGGTDSSGTALTDMMYMSVNGDWTLQPAIRSSTTPQQSGCVQYQNALWIIGGKAATGGRNRSVLYYFPNIS